MAQNPLNLNVGDACLAGPVRHWAPATIHRVNEDGTYTIEFDQKRTVLMPYWYGVTTDEISVNDEELWPDVFNRLTGGEPTMNEAVFADALTEAGYVLADEQFDEFWDEECTELFGIDPKGAELNADQAYQLFRRGGCVAKSFVTKSRDEIRYFKLYWNKIRMGGRRPQDLSRDVTLDDAFTAMGIDEPTINAGVAARLDAFETENDVTIPETLRRLITCQGIEKAVLDAHPNNPELVPPGSEDFVLLRNPKLEDGTADFGAVIMLPHQGGHTWSAVFNEGDSDARVAVAVCRDEWTLTAPSIGMFFWDLAQTGLIWYQDTKLHGDKPTRNTDIGVAPAG